MAKELERQALLAFLDEEYDGAVRLYGEAIKLNPSNPELYCGRAAVYIEQKLYTNAVADAKEAIKLNQNLSQAHFRKGDAKLRGRTVPIPWVLNEAVSWKKMGRVRKVARMRIIPQLLRLIKYVHGNRTEEAGGDHQEAAVSSRSPSELPTPMETVPGGSVGDMVATPMEPVESYYSSVAEEKDEKLEGDAALNKLFQDNYKNADEDTPDTMTTEMRAADEMVIQAAKFETVYIKQKLYTDAVADAKEAIKLHQNLSQAHFRKGEACFHLEVYSTAKAAFEAGRKVDPDNSKFQTWISKCDAKLREEAGGDYQEATVSPRSPSETPTPMETVREGSVGDMDATPMDTVQSDDISVAEIGPTPPQPAPPKYRHEYSQTADKVVVTIFAENIQKEQLVVEIGPQILQVRILVPGEDEYILSERLFGKVNPPESKHVLMSTRVEIRLVKADATHWKKLEYDPTLAAVPTPSAPEPAVKYPSSNKKCARDGDRQEAEVKKEEKDEKLEGDGALNKLFQDIYKNADEDTRRAMGESFVESSDTVLSTNWKEVRSKEVEKSPRRESQEQGSPLDVMSNDESDVELTSTAAQRLPRDAGVGIFSVD
ncbi:hypothetical protein R1sor_015526 [Riccia sorocarpa]|uniref:SGT1 n=1 Tax=Riccia sorocarpa TaxID=122646 RepID=A0ABD3HFI2_9MARC